MDTYTKLLCIWDLSSSGQSIPLSFALLISLLESEAADEDALRIFDRWCAEAYIKANVHGEFLLTETGLDLRRRLDFHRSRPESRAESEHKQPNEKAWASFRRLLSYYIDCITLQEMSHTALYEESYRREYLCPSLPFAWLKELQGEYGHPHIVKIPINTVHDKAAQLHLLSRKEDDEGLFIGYPIEIFKSDKVSRGFRPIGIIPVTILSHTATELTLELHLDATEVNNSWLRYQFPDTHAINVFLKKLHQIHAQEDDAFFGCLDLHHALTLIQAYARSGGQVQLNPNNLNSNLHASQLKGNKSQMLNSALLYVGPELKFSKTLRKELRFLRDHVKSEQLDQTALAYVFRDPPMKQNSKRNDTFSFPFIPSNDEQNDAVWMGLNQCISRITGPPGTGKSQVAVNLIANHVLQGQSVLFTSKNHRAIHAIADRSDELLKGSGLYLVNFCSSVDGSTLNPWHSQDLERLINNAKNVYEPQLDVAFQKLQLAAEVYHRAEVSLAGREEVIAKLAQLNDQLSLEESRLMLELDLEESEIAHLGFPLLQSLIANERKLGEVSTFSIKPRRFAAWLRWKLYGQKAHQLAYAQLSSDLPEVVAMNTDVAALRDKIRRIALSLKAYLETKENYASHLSIIQSLPDSEPWKKRLSKHGKSIRDNVRLALKQQMSKQIIQLAQDRELVDELERCLSILKKNNSPFLFSLKDKKTKAAAEKAFSLFSKFCPAWAVTLLSLTKASPCLPSLFDLVIIDEASQCEIAPIIPALFRAKRVCVIGDPQQFPPVITLNNHAYVAQKNRIDLFLDHRFNYCHSTCYQVVRAEPVMLKQHFRCNPAIAAYFNQEFYSNQLDVCTDTKSREQFIPHSIGIKDALHWIHVHNSFEKEIEAVSQLVDQLLGADYPGSIGIITPLREHAHKLEAQIGSKLKNLKSADYRISTVHSYQGGEMDLIIFVLGYSEELKHGQKWYITEQEHRYIFNVAVSRARACLILVGDREQCKKSQVRALEALAYASSDTGQKPPFDSVWEERFYHALSRAGVITTPQRRVGCRRLDLALEQGAFKLDIEVDGSSSHKNVYGERNTRDLLRDIELEGQGWVVQRFWVYELRNNMDACVQMIKDLLDDHNVHRVCQPQPLVSESKPYEITNQEMWIKYPQNKGFNNCVEWMDFSQLHAFLERLRSLPYRGSLAVLSPFAEVVNKLKTQFSASFDQFDHGMAICTLDDFVGRKRDLIILVLGISDDERSRLSWYEEEGSRALVHEKALAFRTLTLCIVGPREYCKLSGIPLLKELASKPRKARRAKKMLDETFDSPWEQRLYSALMAHGISTQAQYHLAGKRLDLAYMSHPFYLDIEIDGDAYHLSSQQTIKESDRYRDQQIHSLGWHVLRISVFDLERSIESCVQRIKQYIQRHTAS